MAGLRKQIDPELTEAEGRFSLFRFFVQCFRRLDDEMEESAARERVRTGDPVPAFLLGVHLLCGSALMASHGGPAGAPLGLLVALCLLLGLDLGLWGWQFRRRL